MGFGIADRQSAITDFSLSAGTYDFAVGSYIVGARDSNGCESTNFVDIFQPGMLSFPFPFLFCPSQGEVRVVGELNGY